MPLVKTFRGKVVQRVKVKKDKTLLIALKASATAVPEYIRLTESEYQAEKKVEFKDTKYGQIDPR